MIGGFKQVIAAEGTGALLTGLGATASGYFVQGWFKFGGVEFFKINFAGAMGEQVRLCARWLAPGGPLRVATAGCKTRPDSCAASALQAAWDNRTAIYLGSSACAEFIADLFLCPLEAVRIRSVSDKAFPQSLPGEQGTAS